MTDREIRLRQRIDELRDRCEMWEDRCEELRAERDLALEALWEERDEWRRERGNIRRLLRAARESRNRWRERFRAEAWGAKHS